MAQAYSLQGRTVLVTGATGFFGQAFIRHILQHESPRSVRAFSRDEAKQAVMKSKFTDDRLRFLIGDVRDYKRLLRACRGVDVVVHAAALKRVESCEENPSEAVDTNILGTLNLANACIERGVERAVLLSTDKAAAPNTLYGATKLTAERLWVASNDSYAAGTVTRFACSRYGNVLGSTGSVVPVWRQQAMTGTLTMTMPDASRFWMTEKDAVELVLTVLREMEGGEIFIPRVGAAPIWKLARAIAPDAQFSVVGLKPGEKVHETLIGPDETRQARDAGSHWVLDPLSTQTVGGGVEYRSDTAPQLSVEQLREMIA